MIRIKKFVCYNIIDFDYFTSDFDFITIETLTEKKISDFVTCISNDPDRSIFQNFVLIRKALHYLLRTDRESLKCINRTILDLFLKEISEEIEDFLQPVPT